MINVTALKLFRQDKNLLFVKARYMSRFFMTYRFLFTGARLALPGHEGTASGPYSG
jgi:hypothetical protein